MCSIIFNDKVIISVGFNYILAHKQKKKLSLIRFGEGEGKKHGYNRKFFKHKSCFRDTTRTAEATIKPSLGSGNYFQTTF